MTNSNRPGDKAVSLFTEPRRRNVFKVGFAYAFAGRSGEAMKILEHTEEKRFSLVEVALVYSILGDMDQAFAYLNRAFAESPAALYYIAADPGADAMREDPRWQEFVGRLEAE